MTPNMNRLVKSLTSSTLISFARNEATAKQINPNKFKDKVAVITDSTEGIGFAIAEQLAKEGANVVISGKEESNVSSAFEKLMEVSVHGVKCDIRNETDRKNLFEETINKFGGIDILVSNATEGNQQTTCAHDLADEAACDKIFEINIKFPYLLAKEALPYFQKRGGGDILFVSSILGNPPFKPLGPYAISRTALVGITKSTSMQLDTERIRVNGLAPGIVVTKVKSPSEATESENKRLANPHEVACVASFLISGDAKHVNGTVLVASGGMRRKEIKKVIEL